MSRAMKDSGIPWIGAIPKDWTIELIGNQVKEVNNPNTNGLEDNALQFKMGSIISKSRGDSKYNPETLEGYNIVDKGVIMLNGLNLSFDLISQRVGLVRERGVITSTYLAVKPSNNIDSEYLTYLFKAYDNCKAFHSMGRGLRQTLSYGELRKYLLLYPSLAEQQRIAEFLDRKCAEVDEMIALQEQIIEELKAYKQSVITEAVTKGLNPDAPMRDSGIEWIGPIPEHWEVKRLKFVAERHNQKVSDEVLPYIGLENVESFSERFIETENEYDITQAQVCAVGDVIFGKLRPYLGKAMVIKTEHCCSSEFLVLSGSCAPSYLRYLMLSDWFVEIVNASTYGTKMPRANADYIMNMQVVCPPIDERKVIADYLDDKCADIDSLIQTKQSKIDSLKEYKKSIIYEYVTGKREVNE